MANRTQRPLSQHPEIRKQLALIKQNWIRVGQARKLPRRLIQNINTFGSMAINRDDRGVNQQTIKNTITTLRHIKSALRSLTKQDHCNKEAKCLLIQLQHHTNFELTANAAREFAGRVQICGKRASARRAVCDQKIDEIKSADFPTITLRRVVSEEKLLSVGRTLELCVRHKDTFTTHSYFKKLRNLEMEFWSLEADASTFALLSVDCVDGARRVDEFEGHAHGNPSESYESLFGIPLDRTVLQQVARKLDLQELDMTFSEAGVFVSLLIPENESKYEDFEDADANYRVWLWPDELIIRKEPKVSTDGESPSEIRWSRFCRLSKTRCNVKDWDIEESAPFCAMDASELITVMLKSPKLTRRMREQMN
ncbi:MAG: hypothetical protein F4W90_08970 [Gammaproteobacteria bacterium]|nr:hypothetical protein [Gammaproteobacteria bacterium]